MKGKKRLCVVIMLTVISVALLPADTISVASKSDFDELASLWESAHEENSYIQYQDKLAEISASIIPEDVYQYMFGEALFYRYFASSYIDMPENSGLDVSLDSTISYCISVEDEYPVLRTVFEFFRSLTEYAPYSRLSKESIFSVSPSARPVEEDMMPDAASGRLLMLRTLAEVEAMNQRLIKAAEARGGDVVLKFSSDAFLNVMEKPAMIYVITHEPVYANLHDVLERSSADVDVASYGATADAFYLLEANIARCESFAASQGIPLSAVLSEEAWTTMMLYHTDPFAVLCLNENALNRLNTELQYVGETCMLYIGRINQLPEKRETF